MRALRRAVQTLSLVLFLLLLFLAGNPTLSGALPLSERLAVEIPWPVEIFLQMSPLLALSAFLATGSLPPGVFYAALILGSALLFGRLFCGWLCPLGALLNLSSLGRGPARREAAARREVAASPERRAGGNPERSPEGAAHREAAGEREAPTRAEGRTHRKAGRSLEMTSHGEAATRQETAIGREAVASPPGGPLPVASGETCGAPQTAGRRDPGRTGGSARRGGGPLAVKDHLLLFLLPAAFLSLQLAGVMDPLALLTRSLGVGLTPLAWDTVQSALGAAWRLAGAGGPPRWLEALGQFSSRHVLGARHPLFYQAPLLLLLFLLIVSLSRVRIRFWCRYLCPLGALLGLAARGSALTLREAPGLCNDCQRCRRVCPAAASPWPAAKWKRSECFGCWNCVAVCEEGALSFGLRLPAAGRVKRAGEPDPRPAAASPTPAGGEPGGDRQATPGGQALVARTPAARRPTPASRRSGGRVDLARRSVTLSLGAGLAAPLLLRGGSGPDGLHPLLIRPPGALPERPFLETCIRCGLCMKSCLTGVIQPTLAEARLEGLWTPRLVMKLGYCEFNCTLCGQVCPTGALRELTLPEKTRVHIGTAFIRPDRCLPYAFQRECIVCEEHCPTPKKAIYFVEEEAVLRDGSRRLLKLPRVDPDLCIGCGICEFKCPVKDRPAIYVTRIGESRDPESAFLLRGAAEGSALPYGS